MSIKKLHRKVLRNAVRASKPQLFPGSTFKEAMEKVKTTMKEKK